MARLPQLIAFDLDYTLWDLWIDTHVTPPLKRDGNAVNQVTDKYGKIIALYPDVPKILHRIRESSDVCIAACSRTHAPPLAREALGLILVPPRDKEAPQKASTFFDEMEIYPGSKRKHFHELQKRTGIPYSEMLFFDDEYGNRDVESLGVTFVLVKRGLDEKTFEKGLSKWRKQHETLEDPAKS